MKKLIILNSVAIFIAVLLFLNIDDLLSYSWGWGPILLLLPVAVGALAALIQNKDRSYKYLPRIIFGAFMFSFLVIFLGKAYVYFGENISTPLFTFFNPFKDADEMVGHFGLAGIYIFGGLIGIVIRGANLVFLPKHQLDLSNLSRKNFIIIMAVLFIVLSGGVFYISTLDKNIWLCQEGEWIKDGEPNYEKPNSACVDGTPYFWNDGSSGLEIVYPESWRGKINISHHKEEDKRVVRFDYKNPGKEDKMLFSVSIFPIDFGLDKIYSLPNQRPILQSDKYIITVAEGEMPSDEEYGLLYYDVEAVVNALTMNDPSSKKIESGPEIYWQYQDDEYGFSMDYPSNLKINIKHDTIIEYSEKSAMGGEFIDKIITFVFPNGGPGLASINIYESPDVKTIDEWLVMKNEQLIERNKKYPWNSRVVEKERVDIDGNEAIVTYKEDDNEAYEYEKTAAFFKDGKLFTIYSRCEDCGRWWEGFKFD